MVNDGTESEFNDSFWVPDFDLPMVDTLLRGIVLSTRKKRPRYRQHFLNFILPEEARQLVGVDITPVFEEELEDKKGVNKIG